MEDFGLGMLMGAVIAVFITSMIFLGVVDNARNDARTEQRRYELCLKNDMQWVDGNCIGNK